MIDPQSIARSADDDERASLERALGAVAASPLVALLLEHCARSRNGLAVKSLDTGRCVWVNAAMAALLGRTREDAIGRGDAELLPRVPSAALRSAEQAALAQPQGALAEHRIQDAGGVREYSVLRMALAAEPGAAPRHVVALWSDVGAGRAREQRLAAALEQLEGRQREYQQLRRERDDAALHDADTGLYRGAHFDDLLRREIDLSSREHREFALVVVALDPPPPGGAPRSDEARARIVEALARQLRNRTRAMDASCRLGDERFAVVLSGVGLATAHARMEGLRRQCAAEIVVQDGRDLSFTVAMGVASYPHTADTQEALVTAADQALGEAERRGGNQVALASIRFDAS